MIPRFDFPWPSACHPHARQAEQGALAFAERHGLVPTAAYRSRLERTRYGWLAARCYPDADDVLLQLCADYFIWFFIVDDLFVDRVDTLSERTIPNLTAMIDVLDHHRPGAEPVFGEHAWLDVCTRLRAYLSDEHFQRFAHGMRMWAATAGLQIANHLGADTVDVAPYETIRRHTSGTNPCLALADAAKHGPVTPAEYHSPPVQRLVLHANNVVCWSNDVQSLKMELNQPGQYWNMAAIYAHRGLSLQQAVDLVALRVRGEIASFQSLALTLEPHASRPLRGFVDGLRHWMRGYQDWVENDTLRYADAFIAEDADDTAVRT
ncbi:MULTISPECIES: sesquiterpene cyclase [Kitasatospora]|uniref:(+)-corvol ether B synthase/(+)-corvol ether A synthase ((2E,6E)-farnesyl diphosphate cyclizing) n=1 Tax=Kitasatospora setae (strain ATCC 33774 / DSM 43861 / JCM 3304 / KCC A-0304 / NBRC 14216 / KM-6054) TaxID=452652 RepID=CEABS_KITSK|nr:sesquiterpene cyclase [Kitasatospora setae]E4N7E5.1 RecName: Full=(+)-corvol ether B synthase/(+)-corvol ether A synthase ((2E,6E)-farnesyl diphosphate cyclizing); AltName: Full=Terpene synthase; AltName: Full=Type I terpene cyclase [Kitasatospora setae KM-6054]BAJ27126.1 putative sesquiterpene cyclase [Kitasatospora setae KM-6054]